MTQDVKKVEAALAASEEKFRLLIQESPVATCLFTGKELVIEIANDLMLSYWGKDRSIIGKTLLKALPELENQPFPELLDTVFTTGNSFSTKSTSVVFLKDGIEQTSFFDFTYKPLLNAEGKVYAIMGIAVDVTDQVKARQIVEQNELKLKSLIAAAPAGIGLFVGRDLIIENPNQTFIDIVGKGADIAGKPLREVMPELLTEGQPFLQILDDVFTTGVMFQSPGSQVKIIRNGVMTYNYYNITYTPLFNDNNEVYAILDIAIDVTGEILAKRELEESELFSKSMIEHSPVAKIVYIGEEMRVRTINPKMLELLGRTENVIGKTYFEILPELKDSPVTEQMLNVIRTGESFVQPEEKLELIRFGKPYTGYYAYTYKALTNTEGQIYGMMATATEITKQVTDRKKLEEIQNSLRGAIDLADLGTWSIDLQTGILDYDARLRGWFGMTPDEVITVERAYQPIREEHRILVKNAIHHAITPGTDGIYDVEYSVVAELTGRERILHAQGKTLTDAEGKAVKIAGTVKDVTEERHMELALTQQVQERTEELAAANEELAATNEELAATNEELAATNEELTESNNMLILSNDELAQYAYVASHDLQEPLRKIRVFSGMLGEKELPPESLPLVEKINKSSERMSLLINDLLNFSRLIQPDKKQSLVDLNEIVTSIISDFELTITEKNALVEVGKLPVISAVPLQMNQLLYNLLSNALKFTDPSVQPSIRITAMSLAPTELLNYIPRPLHGVQYHRISIHDNGIGFDEKYIDQIFEVFKRLHGKEHYPGSGIGLALCRKIVVNHGGHLYAESSAEKGSAFHIILPN